MFKVFLEVLLISAVLFYYSEGRVAVLAGGNINEGNTDVYGTFLNLTQSYTFGTRILICTGASDTPKESASYYINLFRSKYHVLSVTWLPIDMNNSDGAYKQQNVDLVSTSGGLFFGGGDQSRLFKLFYNVSADGSKYDTPVLAKIRELYESNRLIIAGTSAGSDIQQQAPMVTGGLSWEALVNGAHSYISDEHPNYLSYQAEGGFGFFDMGILDTHVGTMGRQGRNIRLLDSLAKSGFTLGFGIDEDTAIKLIDNEFEVVGWNGVYIYNISGAKPSPIADDNFWSLADIKVSWLTMGDTYNSNTQTVKFANWKNKIHVLDPSSKSMAGNQDIFSSLVDSSGDPINPEQFTNITLNLMDSDSNTAYGTTPEGNPQYRVDFVKKSDLRAVAGIMGTNRYVSYKDLSVSIYVKPQSESKST